MSRLKTPAAKRCTQTRTQGAVTVEVGSNWLSKCMVSAHPLWVVVLQPPDERGKRWYIPTHITDAIKTNFLHKCLQDLDPLYRQICGECILSCEYFPLLFSWFNWLWKSSQTTVAELFRQHTPCTYSERRQPPFQSVDQMCIFLKCSYAADTFCLHRK